MNYRRRVPRGDHRTKEASPCKRAVRRDVTRHRTSERLRIVDIETITTAFPGMRGIQSASLSLSLSSSALIIVRAQSRTHACTHASCGRLTNGRSRSLIGAHYGRFVREIVTMRFRNSCRYRERERERERFSLFFAY